MGVWKTCKVILTRLETLGLAADLEHVDFRHPAGTPSRLNQNELEPAEFIGLALTSK